MYGCEQASPLEKPPDSPRTREQAATHTGTRSALAGPKLNGNREGRPRVCRRSAASRARLLAPSGAAAFGRAGASRARAGAAATSLSMRVCRRGRSCCRPCASVLLPAVLRPSAAPAPPAPLSAGFGRSAGGTPESGFIGRRRRLCRAIPPNLNGRGLPSHEWCSKLILKPQNLK